MDINIPVPDHDNVIDVRAFSRMSEAELYRSIAMGERYVVYYWTLSMFIYTTTRHTKAYRLRDRRSAFFRGLPYTLICLVFGWWHFPGCLINFNSLYHDLRGGADVSGNILEEIRNNDPRYQYGLY